MFSTPAVARRFGVTVARLRYAIDTYKVQPTGKIGNTYFWDHEGIERIVAALKRVNSDRPLPRFYAMNWQPKN